MQNVVPMHVPSASTPNQTPPQPSSTPVQTPPSVTPTPAQPQPIAPAPPPAQTPHPVSIASLPLQMAASSTTTMTTVNALAAAQQQHMAAAAVAQQHPGAAAAAHHGMQQVQVIQHQPLQTNAYLQQLYNAHGHQLLMPGNIGNIALHPAATAGMNPATSIQVITAGKTFQPNQITPHMLTAAGYATIPTSAGAAAQNQTLVIGQLGLIGPQTSILPAAPKPGELQKVSPKSAGSATGSITSTAKVSTVTTPSSAVTSVSQTVGLSHPQAAHLQAQPQAQHIITTQAQSPMLAPAQAAQLISPVQVLPHQAAAFSQLAPGITWATPSHILAQNPIYIRGCHPHQESMFIQSPQPQLQATAQTASAASQLTTAQALAAAGHHPLAATIPTAQLAAAATALPTSVAQVIPTAPGKSSPVRPSTAAEAQQQQQQQQQAAAVAAIQAGLQQHQAIYAAQQQVQQQQAVAAAQAQAQTQILQPKLGQTAVVPSPVATLGTQAINIAGGMVVNPAQAGMTAGTANVRALSTILPTSGGIRPASSVSTQTATTTAVSVGSNSTSATTKPQAKLRAKPMMPRPPASAASVAASQRADAANQTKLPLPTVPGQRVGNAITSTIAQHPQLTPGIMVTPNAAQQLQQQQLLHMQLAASSAAQTLSPLSVAKGVVGHSQQQQQKGLATVPLVQIAPNPSNSVVSTSVIPQSTSSPATFNVGSLPVSLPSAVKESPAKEDKSEQGPKVLNGDVNGHADKDEKNHNGNTGEPMDTAENGDTDAESNPNMTNPDKATNGPPKALVKPQVLTHVIEGFVIREAAEPFPVDNTAGTRDVQSKHVADDGEPPKKKQAMTPTSSSQPTTPVAATPNKCESCGKQIGSGRGGAKTRGGLAGSGGVHTVATNRRFCGATCAKRFNASLAAATKRKKDAEAQAAAQAAAKAAEEELIKKESAQESAAESADDDKNKVNPLKWTVTEVCEFIRSLPGCVEYADEFAVQEIDGQALMLLKADHLMQAMSMKLGPALKICAQIDVMRAGSGTTEEGGNGASPAEVR